MTTKLTRKGRERLLKLADLLENFAETKKELVPFEGGSRIERFDLQYWRLTSSFRDCGTTACACGFAALHPWFRRRGLGATYDGEPTYDGGHSFTAVGRFFQIEHAAAVYLFVKKSYPAARSQCGPESVAKRIRAFVADPGVADV